LWDNPYDENRNLTIDVNEEFSILMTTIGTKVVFVSRVPNDLELHTCPHFNISSEIPWNPSTIRLGEIDTSRSADAPPPILPKMIYF
jgi:hypothetical protein